MNALLTLWRRARTEWLCLAAAVRTTPATIRRAVESSSSASTRPGGPAPTLRRVSAEQVRPLFAPSSHKKGTARDLPSGIFPNPPAHRSPRDRAGAFAARLFWSPIARPIRAVSFALRRYALLRRLAAARRAATSGAGRGTSPSAIWQESLQRLARGESATQGTGGNAQ